MCVCVYIYIYVYTYTTIQQYHDISNNTMLNNLTPKHDNYHIK